MMRAIPPANLALVRAFALPFALLAGAFVVGVLGLGWLGIAIDVTSWRTMSLTAAIMSGLVAAAAWLGNTAATSAALSLAWALLMPAPLAIISYAFTGFGANMPLVDASLARIDGWLGFGWLAAVAWFNEHPSLVWVLAKAYHGTIVPLLYAVILLNVMGRRDRVVEIMVLIIGTCLLSTFLSALFPAVGAYVHFRPDEAIRGAISADAGVWHLAHFDALRSGTFTQFSLTATEGLTTFPSFHTAAALSVPLALRGLNAVSVLAWAVAGTIIVATIPIGGHYLIDVIAGGAITVALHAVIVKTKLGEIAMRPDAMSVAKSGRSSGEGSGRVLVRRQ